MSPCAEAVVDVYYRHPRSTEEEYRELLEDMQDLRDALKAEEEYLTDDGKLFSEYDKQRSSKKR